MVYRGLLDGGRLRLDWFRGFGDWVPFAKLMSFSIESLDLMGVDELFLFLEAGVLVAEVQSIYA
jgi:hypothetical protein